MKYLGIDYGHKKVGIAQSDDDGRIAFPLMVSPNDAHLIRDTTELIKEMKVGAVVIGESVDGKGKPNPIAKDARKFGLTLEQATSARIVFQKEWSSSVEARKQPGREDDHNVDDSAAAIILQRYLDKANGPTHYEEGEAGEEDGDDSNGDSDSW